MAQEKVLQMVGICSALDFINSYSGVGEWVCNWLAVGFLHLSTGSDLGVVFGIAFDEFIVAFVNVFDQIGRRTA